MDTCTYTPTGWEEYPRKEFLTSCGLRVTQMKTESMVMDGQHGYKNVQNPLVGTKCMKCKKPITHTVDK